jgi:ADP-L-glycero-D-manno-heptose 6-epimerase
MILVTGSEGFIGSRLVNKLEADDYEVKRVDTTLGDVFRSMRNANWDSIKRIYHLGAITDTTLTNLSIIDEHNIKFTTELMTHACDHKIPVHYASSASVYGNYGDGIINPLNLYALSKAIVDRWVLDRIKTADDYHQIVGFRFFNVYDEFENKPENTRSIVSNMLHTARYTPNPIQVFEGSKSIERDFVHVDDVVELMTKRYTPGIYEVGTGKSINIYDLAQRISKKFNSPVVEVPFPTKLLGKYQYATRASTPIKHAYKSLETWIDELDV